jgi:hypothetical protein
MIPLRFFFSRHRNSVLLVLSLVVIENVAWILEPSVFGDVIDVCVDKSLTATSVAFILPVSVWIGLYLINSGMGSIRKIIDPRIYLRIYTDMAVDVARTGFDQHRSLSMTAARADLIREYITFFQYRLPEIMEQFIAIGGALIALAFFDLRIAAACTVALVPLGFLTASFSGRIERLQQKLHDTRESAYDAFATRDLKLVEHYFAQLAASEQAIARLTGFSFGVVRLFLLGIFLVVLYISIDINRFSTGDIFAIVAYIWTFIGSTEYLPELMESWTSLKELNGRLAGDITALTAPL